MGTDVYLEWDGMTEEEKKAQYTGFSIDAGRVGYLRASIGMVRENQVLHELFPEEYWKSEKPLEYDSVLFGIPLKEMTDMQIKQMQLGEIVMELFKGLGVTVKAHEEGEDAILWAVKWLNSVFDFFRLGMEKQKEGKKPKVYISW